MADRKKLLPNSDFESRQLMIIGRSALIARERILVLLDSVDMHLSPVRCTSKAAEQTHRCCASSTEGRRLSSLSIRCSTSAQSHGKARCEQDGCLISRRSAFVLALVASSLRAARSALAFQAPPQGKRPSFEPLIRQEALTS